MAKTTDNEKAAQRPVVYLRAAMVESADAVDAPADAPVTVRFSTGSDVVRSDWWTGEQWIESLQISENAIDAGRLNAGAPLLRDHQNSTDAIIGVTVPGTFRIEGGAALVDVRLSSDPADAGIVGKIRDKLISNVSVGYTVQSWDRAAASAKGGMERRTATRWTPMEISAVAVPADPAAQIRSADGRALEFTMSQDQDQIPSPQPVDVAAIRAQIAADFAIRSQQIKAAAKAVGATSERADELIADAALTVDAARAQLISEKVAAQAEIKPQIRVVSDARDARADGFKAALLVRSGSAAAKDLTDRDRELARPFLGRSFVESVRQCLLADGNAAADYGTEQMLRYAMRAQSSSDFPKVLAAVVDKGLLAAYAQQPKAYQDIAIPATISNLRTRYPTILSGAYDLEIVAEGAAYPNRPLLESRESYSMNKGGQIIGLTLEAMIKDDLGAFARIPQALADAAVRRENSVVFSLLTANAAMADSVALFHASHSNLITSGAAAPSAATLAATDKLIRLQTGVNGELLGLEAAIVVVPAALLHSTAALFSPRYVPTAASGVLAANLPNLKVVSHPVLDSNSAAVWYMLADPMRAPVLEYAVPADAPALSIEQEASFENDSIQWKVRHWFGAGVVDYRGAAKNPGA